MGANINPLDIIMALSKNGPSQEEYNQYANGLKQNSSTSDSMKMLQTPSPSPSPGGVNPQDATQLLHQLFAGQGGGNGTPSPNPPISNPQTMVQTEPGLDVGQGDNINTLFGKKGSFATRHPKWNEFLTAAAQGFAAKTNLEFYQAQQNAMLEKQRLDAQMETQKITASHQSTMEGFEQQRLDLERARQVDENNKLYLQNINQLDPVQLNYTPSSTPPGMVKLGDQYYKPKPDMQIQFPNTPEFAEMRSMFGPSLPINKIDASLASHIIGETVNAHQKGLAREATTKSIEDSVGQMTGTIQDYLKNPSLTDFQKKDVAMFLPQLTEAAAKDKGMGSTTQIQQVINKFRDWRDKNDPDARAQARKEKVQDASDVAGASERARIANDPNYRPPDPDLVDKAADNILMNYDNLDAITKLSAGDKMFERAVRDNILKRGLSVEKLSNQARESRDYAIEADQMIQPLKNKINTLDKLGQLGPMISRYNDFMQGIIGTGDPQYSQLATEIDLMRKLVAKIHLGVRGAGSPQNAEQFKKKLDEGKMDAQTMIAGLSGYQTFINYYKNMGLRTRDQVRGGDQVVPKWIVDRGTKEVKLNPDYKGQ